VSENREIGRVRGRVFPKTRPRRTSPTIGLIRRISRLVGLVGFLQTGEPPKTGPLTHTQVRGRVIQKPDHEPDQSDATDTSSHSLTRPRVGSRLAR